LKSRLTVASQHILKNNKNKLQLKIKNLKKETYYKLGLFFTAMAKTNDIIKKPNAP